MNASIRYIERKEIDIQKWDRCIDESTNLSMFARTRDGGRIYAMSYYLDKMSAQWDALVLNDYEAVMPLTWNKKFGYFYLYQPAFTPSLGVFGQNVDEALVGDFFSSIPKRFKLIEINLNNSNIFSIPSGFTIHRKNYILELNKPYQEIYAGYRENIKRNIKKAVQANCGVKKNISVKEVIELARNPLASVTNVKPSDFENFESLFDSIKDEGKATYGVFHGEKLLSAAAFFFSHRRGYYILAGNHPDGKTMGTSHYLIDRFIADHAGTPLVLDFEGSDIQSLAFFYESFGSEVEIYPAVRINKLPWFVRLIKR